MCFTYIFTEALGYDFCSCREGKHFTQPSLGPWLGLKVKLIKIDG